MFKKMSKKIQKFTVCDIGMIKWSVFFFALMIAVLIPQLLKVNWYIYGILFILLAIKPIIKIFK